MWTDGVSFMQCILFLCFSRVEAQHHDRGTAGAVAWVENLIVRVGGKVVELLQKGKFIVNGVAVELPYIDDPVVYIEGFQSTVLLNSIVGLQVGINCLHGSCTWELLLSLVSAGSK
jgi:hypothetical protein